MNADRTPHIAAEQYHTTLLVADLSAAIEFYTTRLGFSHAFTWGEGPQMAGVSLDEVQIFLESGIPAPQGCALYFAVDNADELHEFHRVNSVEIIQAPEDRSWELRDYTVRDLDGYLLTFGHRLPVREPRLEIERVEVSVRLERRLAAVLSDLAARKGMTVGECLEETLLHTFEPLGNGVASPHTKSELRYIHHLKEKQGMDYDTHASYRFVEQA